MNNLLEKICEYIEFNIASKHDIPSIEAMLCALEIEGHRLEAIKEDHPSLLKIFEYDNEVKEEMLKRYSEGNYSLSKVLDIEYLAASAELAVAASKLGDDDPPPSLGNLMPKPNVK